MPNAGSSNIVEATMKTVNVGKNTIASQNLFGCISRR
jgi:hypothetical protein